jgi:hypothetical protein
MRRQQILTLASAVVAIACAACGGSSSSTSSPASSAESATSSPASSSSATNSAVGALSGEAASAATGDIPDTQVFLTFDNRAAGYRISYPEGWTRKGTPADITFADKNNVVHIVIAKAPPATPATVASELERLKAANRSLTFTPPATVRLKNGATAIKSTYTIRSAPNSVTGKTVLLVVDRYELRGASGRRATVDLGTPKGVDNVDAYRMMISSFRWQ